VKVEAFYAGSEPEYQELESRLRQYKAQTDKLAVEFVDPFKHPVASEELNISQSGPRIIVTMRQQRRRGPRRRAKRPLTNALIEVSAGRPRRSTSRRATVSTRSPTTPSEV